MARTKNPREARKRRHDRVRMKVSGSAQHPRLSVFRSLKHIHAQVIDDTTGHTLAAASSLDLSLRGEQAEKNKTAMAELVGALVAGRALEKGISAVVFDRGGYRYHGRVKALAEAARGAGLRF